MEKAIITFSNQESITVSEGDLLFPIRGIIENEETFASKWKPVELWPNIHNGLIPSILDVLCSSEFFSITDDCRKVYRSSSVVSVEDV